MPFAQKVAVAVNLNDQMPEVLRSMKAFDFMNQSEVHFLNVYQTTTYAIGLGESAIIYPMESDQKRIREQSVVRLDEIARAVIPPGFKGKLVLECLFSDDPKRMFCEYVTARNIDTIVVAAREKRGFFESSFTQYISKHTKANVIMLKQKN